MARGAAAPARRPRAGPLHPAKTVVAGPGGRALRGAPVGGWARRTSFWRV
jgi:hypothetical protein